MLKSSLTTLLFVYNIILFNSCADKQKSLKTNEKIITERTTVSLSGFEYISDFDKYMAEFTSQKVELNNLSTEGGELIIFNNKTSNYRVYDFWLYGETGKLNYTFWVAKNNSKDFKFIKQIDYQYDRPYYIEDYKTDSLIQYLSYSQLNTQLFDKDKIEVINSEQIEKTKLNLETFFKDIITKNELIN